MSAAPDQLEFEPEGHRYTLNGREVPSVTTVLDPYSGIEIARRKLGEEYMRRAAEFGYHVHMACELYDADELDWEALDEPLVPYVEAWQKFIGDTGFVVMEAERRVYSRTLRYAGTLDRIGIFPGAGPTEEWALLDLKSTTGKPRTVGAQTAAYQAAYEEMHRGRRIQKRYGLQLKPDGTYRLEPLTGTNDFALFQSALKLWRAGWTIPSQTA